MSHSPENKSDLIANRQALLDLLFQEEELGDASAQEIPRRQSKEPLQLSFAQQRLWFLDQWEPGSSTYNLSTAVRLTGLLNFAALERSLNEILRRHEALRTTFPTVDGQPVQVVASPKAFALPVMSLQHLPETEREAEAQRLVNDERSKLFDLVKGPLFRPTLVQLEEEEHILLLTMHHIVSDGWSMGILSGELTVLYEAFSAGHPSPLPELSIQYGDFAKWQREWLQGAVLETQLSYWKKQLEGVSAVLNLPTDRPRPSLQSYRGARQSFELSEELTGALKILSHKQTVTVFMTLLAAFQTLLHRYTGQHDIVIGSPIANRNRTGIEGLIGFFVNTLVLRSDLSGNPRFRELLARVREVALGAYAHQDVPFEKLVEELQPQRALDHSPLFQVMFVLQNAPNMVRDFGGLALSSFAVGSETAKFDLTLSMREEAGRLRGSLQYNTDLFDAVTIERMLGHFEVLLEGIVADPERRLSELPLLTEAEKRQLLVEWNDTKRDYPKTKCIHELFEAQVKSTPDAIAVVFDNQQLTYRELNSRANQLAHYLRKLGIGSEVLVGLCLERSIGMIVAALGVLKAGGAYVPLDTAYPWERLRFMLDDAQISLMLTQREIIEDSKWNIENSDPQSLRPGLGQASIFDSLVKIICLDDDRNEIEKESAIDPACEIGPDQLAYVIYTSGSTGKPKGTLVTHYNVVRLFQATEAWFGFNATDTWTLFHSYAFDFSVWEIWGALLHGGKLVIVPREITRSPEEFASLLIRHNVTVLNQTPSAFRQLIPVLTAAHQGEPHSLRYVIFGGEALEPQTLIPWFECYSENEPKLINMYGITETTVHVTYRPVTRADATSGRGSVIGKPLPDLRVYLLDQSQSLVPVGAHGEIYVGGAGIARGYLNRPELTADKFIYHSFNGAAAQRLYKSGDLARYLPDGNIEFLGRTDDQVKIRGYRIELGEIESVLRQHSGVRQSAVIVREDTLGERQLVAYVVESQGRAVTISELRSFLKRKLPDYMIPSAFVLLESLPLTPNGKVDRQALPKPDGTRPHLKEIFTEPRTLVEKQLAEIWAEILKVERIGIHDNFFDLGGHSLLATQVISRIRQSLEAEVPLRAIFEAPTIEEMALVILANQAKAARQKDYELTLQEVEAFSEEAAELVLAEESTGRDKIDQHG